jgi:hypothetical protein
MLTFFKIYLLIDFIGEKRKRKTWKNSTERRGTKEKARWVRVRYICVLFDLVISEKVGMWKV